MAFEEVMLLNENRRRKRGARRRRHSSPRRRRHYRNDPEPTRRRRRGFGGARAGGMLGTGVTIGDFIGAGAGGLASAIVPKLIPFTKYGWLNVFGSGVVAVGGGALIRATRIADSRFANSFMIGGLTITAIKLLNQLGVLGKAGISGIDEEYEWEDVGSIAPATKVSDVGEDYEEVVL